MKKKLLYLEDEESNRLIVRAGLRRQYEISTVETIEDATFHLRNHQCDLLITDLMLDGSSQMGFLDELKSCYPNMPIVLLTGLIDTNIIQSLLDNGKVDFYLAKPYLMNDLQSLIRDVLCGNKSTGFDFESDH